MKLLADFQICISVPLMDLYLNVEDDFCEQPPLAKLIKTFGQFLSNMVLV